LIDSFVALSPIRSSLCLSTPQPHFVLNCSWKTRRWSNPGHSSLVFYTQDCQFPSSSPPWFLMNSLLCQHDVQLLFSKDLNRLCSVMHPFRVFDSLCAVSCCFAFLDSNASVALTPLCNVLQLLLLLLLWLPNMRYHTIAANTGIIDRARPPCNVFGKPLVCGWLQSRCEAWLRVR
jgi:hypothetical protein